MVGLVANPDVPCVRNAQRLLERLAQLGPCGERVKILLNRAAEPYPISPAQLQSALGQPIFHTFPSDYKAVSSALNSGVPLALSSNTEIATQFDAFTRAIINPAGRGRRTSRRRPATGRRAAAGFDLVARHGNGFPLGCTASHPRRRRGPRPFSRPRASSTSSCAPPCTASCSTA